ncbi:MAG: efflux RND transporter periplasmic adaptor subunit [Rhodobiaceae bacterium]|jgi:multidrug efflux system membrane fusion protein|nr:efflux RND transporter periplasmic adaptor subunit [Rhodobiaceae bacterium]
MAFDPENHETQEIVARPARRWLGVSPAIWTSLVVVLGIVAWLMSGILSENSEPLPMAKPIIDINQTTSRFKVVVQNLEAEPFVNNIKLQARTQADKIVTISAETGGTITSLPVEKGAFVQKGQTICKIDLGARQAQLDQSRALRDARKIEFDAAVKLNKQGYTSKSKLASARAAYDASVAAVKGALVEYNRTQIKAPFGGVLDKRPFEVGHFMNVGEPCGTIIDKDPLLIVAHVAENYIPQVDIGARGTAKLATGETVSGFVRYIAETPDMATRTFRVELEVANKDFKLRDGVSAELQLKTGSVLATRIPQSVLTLGDSGQLSVRVVDGNRVAIRPVRVIADDRGGAVVVGLAASEKVIIRGGEYTRDGREVDFEMEAVSAASQNEAQIR